MNCSSCNMHVTAASNFTKFKCPKCGVSETARCKTCRANSVLYKCEKCGFEGP